jgi:hypothetical protein
MNCLRLLALAIAAPSPVVVAQLVVPLVLGGSFMPVIAADCVDYRDHVQYLDLTPLSETPREVEVSGDFAYVGGSSDLHVVDLAAPGGPARVATLHERAMRLDLEPPFLYATGSDFKVIDVADPLSPKVIGRLSTPGFPGDVVVQGHYAFIFQETYPVHHLLVVDVSDPTVPQIVFNETVPYLADAFVVSGHYLYALSSITFLIFDISNPAQPIVVGSYGGLGFPWDIAVRGDYVFVSGETDWAYGLQVYDASDVTEPRFVTYLGISNAFGLDIEGDLAAVTTFAGDLQLVDIADPTHPVLRAAPAAPASWDVTLEDGVAYLGVDAALERIHVGDGRWVEPLGSLPSPVAIDVDIAEQCAYLLDQTAGLRVVKIGNPSNPEEIGSFPIGLPAGIAVRLPYAYVADGNHGLLTIDVSDPAHPSLAGLIPESIVATDVALLGKYAVLASPNGLLIVNVSQPSMPRVVAQLVTPALESVVVRGHYAFGAAYTAGFLAFDLADPEEPRLVDQIDTPGVAHDVVVDGNLAYVADQSGVAIIDISDPTALAITSIYPTSGDTYGVTGAGGLFYAPDRDLGFICVDATLPEEPVLVGRAELDGRFQRGLVVGDQVVAAAMAGGLGILPRHCEASPVAVFATASPPSRIAVGWPLPNPFAPPASVASIRFDLPEQMAVRCVVFDVQGRLVHATPSRLLEAGAQVATWDGRGRTGAPVPPGVYFARLRMGNETVTRRVVVMP